MKKLCIPLMLMVVLFCAASCGGSMKAKGFSFKAGDESYTWANGETDVFGEAGIAIQIAEDGVYRLSMIASRDVLKSGETTSSNTIALGVKKTSDKEPKWTGKNDGLIIFWLDGQRHVGPVDIDISSFGKVGEVVAGKFSGTADDIEIKGDFSLQRVDDKALQEPEKKE
jgi:hypothetical protein